MINNLLDADDTDDADFFILLIAQPLNPRYPCHPRLKNNIPNGANHLSLNTNHFCFFSILERNKSRQQVNTTNYNIPLRNIACNRHFSL